MVEDTPAGGQPVASVCPWCSATYEGTPESCPSCGATLTGDAATDPSLPGLTAIDAAAIVRAKEPVKKQRNRLLSWISGEYPDDEGPTKDTEALAPPDAEVRREILRLELEAEVAALQAEADALRAEATVEGRLPEATAADAAASRQVVAELDAVSEHLDRVDEALDTDSPVADQALPPDTSDPSGSSSGAAPA